MKISKIFENENLFVLLGNMNNSRKVDGSISQKQ